MKSLANLLRYSPVSSQKIAILVEVESQTDLMISL